jgi:hypothetical protein
MTEGQAKGTQRQKTTEEENVATWSRREKAGLHAKTDDVEIVDQ